MDSAAPGRDRVVALFDALTEWYTELGFRGCAVVNAATDHRARSTRVTELARAHLARYRGMLERHLRDAGVADPAPLARQLLVLVEGATVVALIDGGPRAGRDARAAALTLLDSAVGATS